jgi:hypothetical protein
MKILIIHPDDPTTDFLQPIYSGISNRTVITKNLTRAELREAIQTHDQIMMMGHGSPSGLFSVGQFPNNMFVIDKSFVDLLSEKDNNVFIWCNADVFVKEHNLKGLFSGMFISEVHEAAFCGIPFIPQSTIDESNETFAELLGNYFSDGYPLDDLYTTVKYEYGLLAETNDIANYNNQRLYLVN